MTMDTEDFTTIFLKIFIKLDLAESYILIKKKKVLFVFR